ncbi:hypothetical protein [Endozoicomonas acroporae]|uniref:hypothetical protein n=1 Tax=Endozoicomonas acroporae TaxID=1701104 RepID=UPI0013D1DB8C|nr:hypothetical protein [Endozoicomonas acroporae]
MEILKEATVKIKTEHGEIERPAMVSDLCPGLAICHCTFARFNVTHVKSGTKIGATFKLFGDALLLFSKLATIAKDNDISWDVDQSKILKTMKKIYDSPVPFDSTVIYMGKERKQTCKEFFQGMQFSDLHSFMDDEADREDEALHLLEKCKSKPELAE